MNSCVVLVLVAEVGLLAGGAYEWLLLCSMGARRGAYMVLLACLVLAAAMPASYLLVDWPIWLRGSLVIPVIVLSLLPNRLVALTGGPRPLWQVAKTIGEMDARLRRLGKARVSSEEDDEWLIEKSRSLDKWRSPETNELIDLYQTQLADGMGLVDLPGDFDERMAAREARTGELVEKLYGFCWRMGARRWLGSSRGHD